ncbi:fasciclin domain-containing protein [Mucilaginibacter paludis]|uniref:Beta-Ig-H3/fasciclin n=1 Tax=Mucilaginibacter paludis DSM 18603 TaxID=714943 RepID=H1Y9V8_9SPHI|nr:fasciclin domain-containing protein [Mucilaginibacter paludis]EHQ31141.1 beta-Ig-H3/fasciclin [Mucilaginibacter paludis DSM 18603]
MERKINIRLSAMFISAMLMFGIWGCVRESIQHTTSDTVNITQYLGKYPAKFSLLSQILTVSETASFLKAYGSYTLFAPTDDAIRAYLKTMGKSNVQDISGAAWKDFVRFHLLADSVPTSRFTDGKLPTLTMYGQYLITLATNTNGITQIVVNRQANISQANISVGNGIIHVVDHVLTPAALTVAQTIEANPKYSIFTQALKETTLYDSLNLATANNPDAARKFLTVIAESDDVFKAAGITSYAALKAKYSKTGSPQTPTDSLHLFMDYHILYGAQYLADIITQAAWPTLAPAQVITSKLSGTTVLINDDDFNGVHEQGQVLTRDFSDVTATNGVINDAATHFGIKVRNPYPVYWDVETLPEITKNTSVYQQPGIYTYTTDEVKAMPNIKFASVTSKFAYYGSSQTVSKASHGKDVLHVPLGTSGDPVWVEFKTPLLIRGTYKVWVCIYAQQQGSAPATEASVSMSADTINFKPLANARTINFATKRPGLKKTVNGSSVDDPDGEEAIGFKTYMASTSGPQVGRLVGVVTIGQSGQYWIRFTAVNGGQQTNNIDMIHFIPLGMDQQYPKWNPDNSVINRP